MSIKKQTTTNGTSSRNRRSGEETGRINRTETGKGSAERKHSDAGQASASSSSTHANNAGRPELTSEAVPDGVDPAYLNMDLLRFTTAGSVDDGKSTLIGRLLYDSKSIFEDQWEALETTTRNRGEGPVNLALLTDGLRAEREQGITIDVAYRYFATPRRKFIIADTPGHEQYTRNMVTGASTADLAIILIDARKGVLTQSRRHAFLSSLLQIPHLVVAVNKMDLVDYSEERFNEITDDFKAFSENLEVDDITYIPISALNGDNIVNSGERMPWYRGATLLHHLEHVRVGSRKNPNDFRFPVQYVIRPDQDYRGFAGRVVSGSVEVGEEVKILPSGATSRIVSIQNPDGAAERAKAGESVVLEIADEIDISRGDMLVRRNNVPNVKTRFEATVSWMNKEPLRTDKDYLVMHTTRTTPVRVTGVRYRINVDSLHREETDTLTLNEIGRICLETAQPVFFDAYKLNNATGSFVLIDPDTNVTVGAGMIRSSSTTAPESVDQLPESKAVGPGRDSAEAPGRVSVDTPGSRQVFPEPWNIGRTEREERNGHTARVLWFTGPSGAGKTTIAKALERTLWDEGRRTMLLDGDQVRHGLNRDLGFDPAGRRENIRRVGELARLFFEHGNVVICTFVSPYRADREAVKALFPESRFTEIHVTASRETLIARDPKGLYKKAEKGEIRGLTGYDASHEPPGEDALLIDTDSMPVDEAVSLIIRELK
ncbi:sulfate adenylyltransferase subunit CysN [Balneolales bacterium ANBcel1]|nr:sulfate adenylyltransferase subunit CysN [Balneolales bacterium ANBcel1]